MAPAAVDERGLINGHNSTHSHNAANGASKNVDTMNPHDQVHFDPSLQPKNYQIKGTSPDSMILFLDVNIIDSTGKNPYRGDVYIEGKMTPCWRVVSR
jgi:hypothetical protein